jgi:hypothetical protein
MGIFGGGDGDYSGAFNNYAAFMGDKANRYNPIIDMGNRARDMNEAEYRRNIQNPNEIQDKVAAGFNYSPYQKFELDNITDRMNYNATNTGMLGTTAANRSLMDDLLKMTSQFQDTYINRGMNSYNTGLEGNKYLTDLGFRGMGAQDALYEQQAAAQLKAEMAEKEAESSGWGDILGGVGGAIAGGLFGPGGASMGSKIGSSLFGTGKNGGGNFLSNIFSGGGNKSFAPGVNAIWEPNNAGGYTQTFGERGVGMPAAWVT